MVSPVKTIATAVAGDLESERRDDRPVVDEKRAYFDVADLRDHPRILRRLDFVHIAGDAAGPELFAVVREPVADVGLQRLLEAFDRLARAGGPVDGKRRRAATCPAGHQEVGEVRDVVGVQVREEHGFDAGGRDARLLNAPRDTPAAIDQDRVAAGRNRLTAAAAVG